MSTQEQFKESRATEPASLLTSLLQSFLGKPTLSGSAGWRRVSQAADFNCFVREPCWLAPQAAEPLPTR
jgi:hypothetical protein